MLKIAFSDRNSKDELNKHIYVFTVLPKYENIDLGYYQVIGSSVNTIDSFCEKFFWYSPNCFRGRYIFTRNYNPIKFKKIISTSLNQLEVIERSKLDFITRASSLFKEYDFLKDYVGIPVFGKNHISHKCMIESIDRECKPREGQNYTTNHNIEEALVRIKISFEDDSSYYGSFRVTTASKFSERYKNHFEINKIDACISCAIFYIIEPINYSSIVENIEKMSSSIVGASKEEVLLKYSVYTDIDSKPVKLVAPIVASH